MKNNFFLTIILFNIFFILNATKQDQKSLIPIQFYIGNSLITIGAFTYGYKNCCVRQWGEGASLFVGKFCSIADNVVIFLGGNHNVDWITTYPFGHINTEYFGGEDIQGHPVTKGDVVIGNDVWIGSHVTIMSGVTIGDGAILAAYSVVTKDVESYAIVAGNPARHVRYRFSPDICLALQKLEWWNLQIEEIKDLAKNLCTCPTLEIIEYLIKKYKKEY